MNRTPSPIQIAEAHHRVALWASVLATLLLFAVLAVARSAQAAPPPHAYLGPAAAIGHPADDDEGEDEEAGELESEGDVTAAECAEEAQEEIEEGEPVETVCEEEDEDETVPEECLIESAEASVAVDPVGDVARLTLRYETYEPAKASISLSFHGKSGAIDHATPRLGHRGVLHLSADLTPAETHRALGGHGFDFDLRALNTPAYCGDIFEQSLDAGRSVGQGRVWTDSDRAGGDRRGRP